jgi:hypothetical protein
LTTFGGGASISQNQGTQVYASQQFSATGQPQGQFFPHSNRKNNMRGRGRGRNIMHSKEDVQCQIYNK